MWTINGAVSQRAASSAHSRGKNYRGQRSELFGKGQDSSRQGKVVSTNVAAASAAAEQVDAMKSAGASTGASNDLLDGMDDLNLLLEPSEEASAVEIPGGEMADDPVDKSEAPVSAPVATEGDEEFL